MAPGMASGGIRTHDPPANEPVLYQLNYRGPGTRQNNVRHERCVITRVPTLTPRRTWRAGQHAVQSVVGPSGVTVGRRAPPPRTSWAHSAQMSNSWSGVPVRTEHPCILGSCIRISGRPMHTYGTVWRNFFLPRGRRPTASDSTRGSGLPRRRPATDGVSLHGLEPHRCERPLGMHGEQQRPFRELSPGPRAPKARIISLDQTANW